MQESDSTMQSLSIWLYTKYNMLACKNSGWKNEHHRKYL